MTLTRGKISRTVTLARVAAARFPDVLLRFEKHDLSSPAKRSLPGLRRVG
jgi:hypothetical protein